MNPKTIVIGVVAFAIGGVSGYFFAKTSCRNSIVKIRLRCWNIIEKRMLRVSPKKNPNFQRLRLKSSILDQSKYKRIITNYSNPPLESLGHGKGQGEPPDDEEFYKDEDDDIVDVETQWYEDAENAEEPDPEPYLIDIGEYQHDEKWDKEEVFFVSNGRHILYI